MNIFEVSAGTPYASYLYSYPHKTAYRPLEPARRLDALWAGEDKRALFLYVHVPFCEMRCGFCNLFTTARPKVDEVAQYLVQLEEQARVVRAALGEARFVRMAIGGGTPTLLSVAELERVFLVADSFGARPAEIPASVECSPETATRERMRLLSALGVERVSIGVQSFLEEECAAMGRPQLRAQVDAALDAIRSERFAVLNIDLIYGSAEQTVASFLYSLEAALRFTPEELYLYPLYVRPLTGLSRSKKSWDDHRLELYRAGRDYLLGRGYLQSSMRNFRLPRADGAVAPEYVCQRDGMVGLGPGARSYTSALHYSSEYAVSARGVKNILSVYGRKSAADFAVADYGVELDAEEQGRRRVIYSLLAEGWEEDGPILRDELRALRLAGLVESTGCWWKLTAAGRERSDAIGPYLQSAAMRSRMAEYELR